MPCGSSLGTVRLSGRQKKRVKTEEDSDANLTGINMSLPRQVLEPRLDGGIGHPRQNRKSALGVRVILDSGYSPRRSVASQRPDCASLVPLNIKHRGQSCHLEQVVYSLVQVYEPKLPTLIPNGCVSLNQLAYS